MNDRIDNLKEELGSEEEVEETMADEEEQGDEETEEEESEEESEESEDEEEETEEESEQEEAAGFKIPKKFQGKSVEEVIQSYQALEKLMGQRTLTGTERKDLKDMGLDRKDLSDMEKMIEETDFTQMKPQEFAKWLLEQSSKNVESRAREIYQTAATVKQAVQTEVSEATDKYPLLKSNPEFRNLTLKVIEADAAQGRMTPIIEAAEKVASLIGGQEKAATKKKNVIARKRTAVETKGSGAGGKKKTDAQRVAEGIMGAGHNGDSPMGGLGI